MFVNGHSLAGSVAMAKAGFMHVVVGGSRVCFVRDPDSYRWKLIEPA